jgi:hypothetical protein
MSKAKVLEAIEVVAAVMREAAETGKPPAYSRDGVELVEQIAYSLAMKD